MIDTRIATPYLRLLWRDRMAIGRWDTTVDDDGVTSQVPPDMDNAAHDIPCLVISQPLNTTSQTALSPVIGTDASVEFDMVIITGTDVDIRDGDVITVVQAADRAAAETASETPPTAFSVTGKVARYVSHVEVPVRVREVF